MVVKRTQHPAPAGRKPPHPPWIERACGFPLAAGRWVPRSGGSPVASLAVKGEVSSARPPTACQRDGGQVPALPVVVFSAGPYS